MCMGCYEGYGSPRLLSPKIRQCSVMIAQVFDRCPVGGGLHIVIEDWNLEDDHLTSCRKFVETEAEADLLVMLESMTLEERASALALHDGYFVPDEEAPAQDKE